jgi:hypothetical protein
MKQRKERDKEEKGEELTSNVKLLKAALIIFTEVEKRAGIARMALVQIRQPLQGQSSAGCVS